MRFRTLAVVGAAGAAGAAAYAFAVRPWWRSWGVDPADTDLALPGDDLVPDASVTETRSIEIGAPPDAVWPWLVQMGYNRAGWYSYDVVDMKGASVDAIVPELQQLAVGDMVPNAPDTAFEVKVVEPGRALVLYADEQLVQSQVAAARAKKEAGEAVEATPANLKAAGKMMPSMPGFAASWAFALEPLDDGRRTRLVERLRVRMEAPAGPASVIAGEAFGFGVFAMVRKQMLGIRDRAEAALIAAGISAEFAQRPARLAPEAPATPAAESPAPPEPAPAGPDGEPPA
jgi:hypothetical protein